MPTSHGITVGQLSPIVAPLVLTGLSQVLALEDALGVTAGHDTTVSFIEQAMARLESSAEMLQ